MLKIANCEFFSRSQSLNAQYKEIHVNIWPSQSHTTNAIIKNAISSKFQKHNYAFKTCPTVYTNSTRHKQHETTLFIIIIRILLIMVSLSLWFSQQQCSSGDDGRERWTEVLHEDRRLQGDWR